MEHENLKFSDIMESRRHAVEESLHTISAEELRALTDKLFPYADHPWLEKFMEVVSDPGSGTFYHALVDHRVHVLYCHNKNIGMWIIPGIGKGPLEPAHLTVMKEVVEGTGASS